MFIDIWNTAYNIYSSEAGVKDRSSRITEMKMYLHDQASHGAISRTDADTIAEDIIETYNL